MVAGFRPSRFDDSSRRISPSITFTVLLVLPIILSFSGISVVQPEGPVYNPVTSSATSSIVHYVNVSLVNEQRVATTDPYNQKVVVDSSKYSKYEASNLMNVIWFEHSGKVIPSWIESGDNNTAIATVYWLNLSLSIPGDSTVVIYLGFVNKSINLFSTSDNEGVAPELTPVYAQYDNGNHVFSFYDNFAGTSLSSLWSFNGTLINSEMSVDNGITFKSQFADNHTMIITRSALPSKSIVETDVTSVNIYAGKPSLYIDGLSNTLTGEPGSSGEYAFGPSYFLHLTATSLPNPWLAVADGSGYFTGIYGQLQVTGVQGLSWPTTGQEFTYLNSTPALVSTNNIITDISSHYLWMGASSGTEGNITWHAQWVRSRTSLPNNVMPTDIVGSTGIQTIAPTSPIITVHNIQSYFSSFQSFLVGIITGVLVSTAVVFAVTHLKKPVRQRDRNSDSALETIDSYLDEKKK